MKPNLKILGEMIFALLQHGMVRHMSALQQDGSSIEISELELWDDKEPGQCCFDVTLITHGGEDDAEEVEFSIQFSDVPNKITGGNFTREFIEQGNEPPESLPFMPPGL